MHLGIEIGGTKLQIGVGAGDNDRIVSLERRTVDRTQGAAGILDQIAAVALKLIPEHSIERIGIGFGGPVLNNTAITSHHIHGWDDFDFSGWCDDRFALPVVVDNDCNVAALAEASLGAGRGYRRCFYVTVGTGIGGGLVCDGEVYGSDRPGVAEIGHLRPGLDCVSESQTVESIASGSGIENQYASRVQLASGSQRIDGKHIATLAVQGDSHAAAVLEEAAQTLGWAIAQVATLVSPDVVVIGGGVSLIGQSFLDSVRRSFLQFVFPPLRDAVQIELSALGEDVVVHGALRLAATSRVRS